MQPLSVIAAIAKVTCLRNAIFLSDTICPQASHIMPVSDHH